MALDRHFLKARYPINIALLEGQLLLPLLLLYGMKTERALTERFLLSVLRPLAINPPHHHHLPAAPQAYTFSTQVLTNPGPRHRYIMSAALLRLSWKNSQFLIISTTNDADFFTLGYNERFLASFLSIYLQNYIRQN